MSIIRNPREAFYRLSCQYCGVMVVKRLNIPASCEKCKRKHSAVKRREKLIKSRELVNI